MKRNLHARGAYPDDCPQWKCPHLSQHDRREGRACDICPPCACAPDYHPEGCEVCGSHYCRDHRPGATAVQATAEHTPTPTLETDGGR